MVLRNLSTSKGINLDQEGKLRGRAGVVVDHRGFEELAEALLRLGTPSASSTPGWWRKTLPRPSRRELRRCADEHRGAGPCSPCRGARAPRRGAHPQPQRAGGDPQGARGAAPARPTAQTVRPPPHRGTQRPISRRAAGTRLAAAWRRRWVCSGEDRHLTPDSRTPRRGNGGAFQSLAGATAGVQSLLGGRRGTAQPLDGGGRPHQPGDEM